MQRQPHGFGTEKIVEIQKNRMHFHTLAHFGVLWTRSARRRKSLSNSLLSKYPLAPLNVRLLSMKVESSIVGELSNDIPGSSVIDE
jgi:hypothetical protein